MRPLVSILIPCFNAAPWLAETIESALAQTWPEKEIIFVDDGSTDTSLTIARSYESRGLKIIAQPNLGASTARNTALTASRGQWIQYLDADDLLATDKIATQLELALTFGPTFLTCGRWSRFVHVPAEATFPRELLCADSNPVDWIVTKFEDHAMMHPAAWLLSRHLSDQIGPWNTSLSLDDDGEYFSRAVLASSGVRYCPKADSFYRSNIMGSLSVSKSERAWESALRSIELTSARLSLVEDSPRTRKARATTLQRFIYEAYPYARTCRHRAMAMVSQLGGSELKYEAGPKFHAISRIFGWRFAKHLQRLYHKSCSV